MPARVIVVAGPAGCGKTERLLAGYRQALAAGEIGRTLWMAPTHRSAAEVRSRLLHSDLRACFSPAVMTFAQFAEQVLAASGQVVRPITELVKRHLIRRLIRAAHEAGRLQHFGPIAATTGLVDLVAEFISELKRAEIWPDDFDKACAQRGRQRKDRELSALYRAYQDYLNTQQLYDAEGRFWSARALLRSGQTRPFQNVRHVVVDGFTDFTRTQHEILEVLAARVDELRISLPLEAEDGRPDLFAKPAQTLHILEGHLGRLAVERMSRPRPAAWPALTHIEQELFKNPRLVRQSSAVARIEIIEAARASDEMYLIVRRIKELLACGDRQSGQPVRPGDVAIVLRSPAGLRAVLEEAFGDLGVPYALDAGRPLSQAPVIAALTSLVRLHAEDWPFRNLLAVLGNNYFQPDWPAWQQGAVAPEVHATIRGLQIARGRETLLAALRRITAEGSPGSEASAAASDAPRHTLAVVERLAAALARLPERARSATWAKALAALASETGLSRAISSPDEMSADVDRAAWDALLESLLVADRFSMADDQGEQLSVEELLDLINDLARTETLPEASDEIGRVRVLSAASARALSIPYLFFAGLSEKAFPPAERSDRLYSEAEYERLAKAGLPLVLRAEHNQEEMLLFYEVLTRARQRLYLSYPGLDEKGQPLLPSPYLNELETIFSGQIERFRVADLSPIPRDLRAAGPVEQRVLALAQAVGIRPATGAGGQAMAQNATHNGKSKPRGKSATAGAAQKSLPFDVAARNLDLLASLAQQQATRPVFDNIVAGLSADGSRAERDAFGPYEGLLVSDAARRRLAERFGPLERWSASRLEAFRACPFQFFLQHVLKLHVPEELSLATDHLERGSTLHDVLAQLHRELNELLARPTSAADPEVVDEVRASLARLLDERARGDDRRQPFQAALAEIDRRVLHGWLSQYIDQHARYDDQWSKFDRPLAPAHFEISFGEERPGGDPLSTETPLKLSDGERELLVRGRIDRLDIGQAEGVPVFSVLDYKSGKSSRHSQRAVESGDDLQVFLYTLAAAEILAAGHRPLVAGYWFIADDGFPSKPPLRAHRPGDDDLQPTEEWLALREANVALILDLVDAIRAGQFPVASRNEHCTSFCDFRTVCRINQVRALEKTWEPAPPQPQA